MNFKPIPGFPNYEINESGEVRNINTQRVLKQYLNTRYMKLTLSKEGTQKVYPVHKLVALTFLGEAEGRFVRHLDGDPTNNSLTNLVYGSNQENQLDRVEHGTMDNILNPRKVRIIRGLRKIGFKPKRLAEIFGVNPKHIWSVVTHKCWTSVV